MTNDHVTAIERESLALVASIDRDPLLGPVIRGDASREEYVRFLASTYHYVRWSGPLLAATAEGLRRGGRYPWLTALVEAKAAEESPHDRWALDDLRRCGENVELIKASVPPVAVRAYVDLSLAMAEAGSPAFLGFAYALEFMSVSRAQLAADNLRARSGIPGIAGAVSFLEGHGSADQAHVALLNDVVRQIDDAEDVAAIQLCAAALRRLYPRFFQLPGTAHPEGLAWAA